MEDSNVNFRIREREAANTREEVSKFVRSALSKTTRDIRHVGVRVTTIAKHYKVSNSTLSNMVKISITNAAEKKMGVI